MNRYRVYKIVEANNVNDAIKKEPKIAIEEISLLEEAVNVGFSK